MRLGMLSMIEVEAASCGAPVVSYVRDRNLPFEPKEPTPKRLAEFLDELIDDPVYRTQYAEAVRLYVATNNDPERIAERYRKAWNSALDTNVDALWKENLHILLAGSLVEFLGRVSQRRILTLPSRMLAHAAKGYL